MRNYFFYFKLFCFACFLSLILLSCGNTLNPVESFIVGYSYTVKLNSGSVPAGISGYEGISEGKTISSGALSTGNGALIIAKPTNGSSRDSAVGDLNLRFTPTGRDNTIKLGVDGTPIVISGFKGAGKSYIEVPIEVTNNISLSVIAGSLGISGNLIQLGAVSSGGKINIIEPGGTTVPLTGTYSGIAGNSYDIKAVSDSGYSFSNMTIKEIDPATSSTVGTYPSPTDTYSVTLNGNNIEVDALFTPNNYNLTIPLATDGSVSLKVDGTTTSFTPGTAISVPYNSLVEITATPDSGYVFSSFTATGVSGTTTGNTYTFTMPAGAVSVTANFSVLLVYKMKLAPALNSILPSGVNIEYSSDGGINWNRLTTTELDIPASVMFRISSINVFEVAWTGISEPLSSVTGAITATGDIVLGGTIHLKRVITINNDTEFMLVYNTMRTNTTVYTGSITLMSDINLAGKTFNGFGDGSGYNEFGGTFDGGGKQIQNISINVSPSDNAGFIRKLVGSGVVKNLTISSGSITGNRYAGAIVGTIDGGSVQNCTNFASVSGATEVGGIVGKSGGTVNGCYNLGSITGTANSVGGVVGQNDNTVQNSYNSGAVSGDEAVGGVTGKNNATVKGSHNKWSVSGRNQIGGVSGRNDSRSAIIENCYNEGTVDASSGNAGGVVGINSVGTVRKCYNIGRISIAFNYAGGIVAVSDGTVENCYNTGSVSGVGSIGGIVGWNNGTTVAKCYNIGTVSRSSGSLITIGSVIGENSGGTVSSCYYLNTSYGVGMGTSPDTTDIRYDYDFNSGDPLNFGGLTFGSSQWVIKSGLAPIGGVTTRPVLDGVGEGS